METNQRGLARTVLLLTMLLTGGIFVATGPTGLARGIFDLQETGSASPTPYVTCLVAGVPPTAPSPICRTVTPSPVASESSEPSSSPTPKTSPTEPGKAKEIQVSTITVEFKRGIHRFTGVVTSGSRICINDRDVFVHKDKSGIDPVVAKAKTTETGSYSVAPKRVEGRYYATVVESKAGKYGRIVTCGAAASKVIKVN